ncbi:hypothetical protein OUZ56_002113 [Daphnia magna]|uniref:Uncharacterized protein n=1 Tax=Daphnia magna TaxID=35525 RepID=A0ABR0A4P8_9CRUS|nr:hypothetical protein OUZ56_002113 [Daphnia magna]
MYRCSARVLNYIKREARAIAMAHMRRVFMIRFCLPHPALFHIHAPCNDAAAAALLAVLDALV